MSARDKFVRFKQVEVSTDASPIIPPEVVTEVRNAMLDFYETVFTRWKGPGNKLEIRHGALVIAGSEAVESGESKTKFAPKPGC